MVQLIQSYCRLAELEIAFGKASKFAGWGYVALPEDIPDPVREWAEGEGVKDREMEELVLELVPAIESRGYDTRAVKAALGG